MSSSAWKSGFEFAGLAAGQTVCRRYLLKRVLGEGGMGVVWLAHDTRLRESVALKFLPHSVAHDSTALERLRREALRSRKLTHPTIVRIHDLYGGEAEPVFISMEFVDGPNLHYLREHRPNPVLPWSFLGPLVVQLCDALEYAHRNDVIHRDLKPANLMLDSSGRLKLADFGLARVLRDSSVTSSKAGEAGGTLPYMSPQQAQGHSPTVADDIYSLGATLYELLTGTRPFHTGDIDYQMRNNRPQPLAERLLELGISNDDLPSDVAALVMACLAKDPAQRPQSAADILQWIGGGTLTARAATPRTSPAEANPTADSDKPEHRWQRFALPMLLIALLGGAAWFWMAQKRSRDSAPTPPLGLVSWWRGESNALDSAGNSPGLMMGGATFEPGKIGSAFTFNGTDACVVVSNSSWLNPSGPFSVACWLKASAQQFSPDGQFLIVDKSHGVDGTGWALQGNPNGTVSFMFGKGGGNAPGHYVEVKTGDDLRDERWHYLAGIFTGKQLTIYQDGMAIDTLNTSDLPASNARDVTIGRWWGGEGEPRRYFHGSIDEVGYYQRALSAAEIESIHEAGLAGRPVADSKASPSARGNHSSPNLLTNGSFEAFDASAPPFMVTSGNSTPGWKQLLDGVDVVHNSYTQGPRVLVDASEGVQFLDLNQRGHVGGLEQVVNATVGATYKLEVDLVAWAENGIGGTVTYELFDPDTGDSLAKAAFTDRIGGLWTTRELWATATSARLGVRILGVVSAQAGMGLDNVRLTMLPNRPSRGE